jgi:hypothetical protein
MAVVGGIREIPAPGFRKVDCGFPAVSQDWDADEANAQTRQKGRPKEARAEREPGDNVHGFHRPCTEGLSDCIFRGKKLHPDRIQKYQ